MNMTTIMEIQTWCRDHEIVDVECLVPDMTGIARGKILPVQKFIDGVDDDSHRLPESVFVQTVTGDYPEDEKLVGILDPMDVDTVLRPDLDTFHPVPWRNKPTSQVICDSFNLDSSPVAMSPRQVLKRTLALFADRGLYPIVAPEMEFYLVAAQSDPKQVLRPPTGRSKRTESGRQSFGIESVSEFNALFDDIYAYCDAQNIHIDTLNHETGAAQFEINFDHGDALNLADQVFLFRRTVHNAALNHGVHATFMAKPMADEPGSSMHIHQSLLDSDGHNVFCDDEGTDTDLFLNYIAGLQTYMPAAMLLIAPNVNSYRRFTYDDAPINTHWGHDNRTCGLRIPRSDPVARRVENRLAGSDANPYLIMTATLICGYLGIVESLTPDAPHTDSVYHLPRRLPQHMNDAVELMANCPSLSEALGSEFVDAFLAVKRKELDTCQQVITSWERDHLLFNV